MSDRVVDQLGLRLRERIARSVPAFVHAFRADCLLEAAQVFSAPDLVSWRRLLELPEGAAVPRPAGCRYAASGRGLAALFNERGEIALDPYETVVVELR